MGIKAVVRFPYEFAVEAFFASARLVSCYQQNRSAFGVEREGYSSFTIRRTEAQLLHICVARAAECVNAWPPQLWPELL